MIKRHPSLEVADKVLADLDKLPGGEGYILGAWSNAREQGYAIEEPWWTNIGPFRRKVVFARPRGGEGVVVFYGLASQFDSTTNMPTDPLWERPYCSSSERDAARFIIRWLGHAVEQEGG